MTTADFQLYPLDNLGEPLYSSLDIQDLRFGLPALVIDFTVFPLHSAIIILGLSRLHPKTPLIRQAALS